MLSAFTADSVPCVAKTIEQRAREMLGGTHSGAKVKQVIELFKSWDADCDGIISRSELRRLMRFATDWKATDVVLDMLMAKADTNRNGQIEFEEFAAWVLKQKSGMFSPDFQPSRIGAAKSPVAVKALEKWFHAIDVNKNGTLEYEEFAISCMYLQPDIDVEDIDDEFDMLGPDGNRRVALDRFLHAYCRLLDAIPRPIEEKVELVNSRCQRLEAAMQAGRARRSSQMAQSGQDPQEILQTRFNVVTAAMREMGWKETSKGMNIVQFRDALRELLQLPAGQGMELETLRRLFRELDKDHSGTLTAEEGKRPAHSKPKSEEVKPPAQPKPRSARRASV